MPSEMIALGIRLTDDAWHNFQEACLRSGLTSRSALEAAVELVSLFAGTPEERLAAVPDLAGQTLEEVVASAWAAVDRIERRHRTAREPRQKLTIRTEESHVAGLREALRQRDVSLNASLASVFTPWGSGWGGPGAYKVRQELWEWAARRARARDYLRRRAMPSKPARNMGAHMLQIAEVLPTS